MYFIVYSSKANHDLSEEELHKILKHSKEYNRRNNITGLLILYNDTFFQMLEGEEEVVKATYERIRNDERHDTVLLLFSGESDKRHFPDWKMALEVVDEDYFRQIDAYENLSEGDKFLNEVNDEHIGLKMLRFFYDQKKNA